MKLDFNEGVLQVPQELKVQKRELDNYRLFFLHRNKKLFDHVLAATESEIECINREESGSHSAERKEGLLSQRKHLLEKRAWLMHGSESRKRAEGYKTECNEKFFTAQCVNLSIFSIARSVANLKSPDVSNELIATVSSRYLQSKEGMEESGNQIHYLTEELLYFKEFPLEKIVCKSQKIIHRLFLKKIG